MRLKDARGKRKWTQEQLEERSGVAQSVISTLENSLGANPTVDTDRRLSKALGVKPGTLEYGPALHVDQERAS